MSDSEVSGAAAKTRAPRARWLALLVLLATLPPLLLQAAGIGVGSFSMFTEPERYRLRVVVEHENGTKRYLPLAELAPHLGSDARRVIVSASDWYVGESHIALLAGALTDVAVLACRLEPSAARVSVLLETNSVGYTNPRGLARDVACHER